MTTTQNKSPFRDRQRVFTVQPFGYFVHVVVSDDIRLSAKKRQKSIGDIKVSNNASAFTVATPGQNDIWLFLPERTAFDTITHETFHAVHFMLTDAGVSFEEEVWAYHLGDLTDRITRFIHLNKTAKKEVS